MYYPPGAGSRERVGIGIMIPPPWHGDRDGSEIMTPLPSQWDRDGGGVVISPPSRSRDLIFDAVSTKPTMAGRGSNARGLGR